MSDLTESASQGVTNEPINHESMLDQLMAEVNLLNDLMQWDRLEILRLRHETWELRAETRILLGEMGTLL